MLSRVHRHVSDPGEGVKGEDLSRKHWTTLNRLRTGVGRYNSSMKKWGLADSAACECGEPEQTADHIINSCPLHRPPSEAGLFEVGPLTRAWLQHTELTIWDDDIRKKKKIDIFFYAGVAACPERTRTRLAVRHGSCGYSGAVLSSVCHTYLGCCQMPPTVLATAWHKLLWSRPVEASIMLWRYCKSTYMSVHGLLVVEPV